MRTFNQIGAGFQDGRLYFSGVRRQRGAGLGAIFGTMAKFLVPFLKKFILPHATTALTSVATDMVSKKQPLSSSIKEHGKRAIKRVGSDIMNQSGSGKRAKRSVLNVPLLKPKRKPSVKFTPKKGRFLF